MSSFENNVQHGNENETLCCHMIKQEILRWWVFGVDNIESDVKGCHRT